jgi:hypothetical protein
VTAKGKPSPEVMKMEIQRVRDELTLENQAKWQRLGESDRIPHKGLSFPGG